MSTAQLDVPGLEFDLADRLRKSLRYSGLSVQEMADYLGVSRNTAGRWINGHFTPSRAEQIAWALRTGVPVEWLATGLVHTKDGPEGGVQPSDMWPALTLAA